MLGFYVTIRAIHCFTSSQTVSFLHCRNTEEQSFCLEYSDVKLLHAPYN
jgi:hypothetical protein